MKRAVLALALAVAAVTPGAFASGTGFETGACALPAGTIMPGSGAVRAVPAGYPTIQAAVDAASEGDTVLVSPGTYNESVTVHTPGLRIRGTDRNTVILDGKSVKEIGVNVDGVDRVVVENMTAHNYKRHGFFWVHATGYWGRYLTAYNNGLYGIYGFKSRCGQYDHSYTSGNADSGYYIGECFPCDAVITDVIAERNALGYSGTNAGGNLTLRNSIWHNNAMGIVPNSLDGEQRPPQRGAIIKNNIVVDNNNITAPGVSIAGTFYGAGIVLAGGSGNVVYGNTVTDHILAGIALAPLPDSNVWIPSGNTIWGNTVSHDAARFPDSVDLAQGAASGPNNCWADNTFGNSGPEMIETIWDCHAMQTPPGGDPRVEASLAEGEAGLNGRAPSDWRTWAYTGGLQPNQASSGGAVESWLPALGL